MTTAPTLAQAAPPPGAALLWTSTDPAILKARELIVAGGLAEADRLLRGMAPSQAVEESLDVIRRIRRDYSLTPAECLAKLGPAIRDLSPRDLDRWTSAGHLQHRVLDGQVCYFRSEPSNLFRFCNEAVDRRTKAPARDAWRLTDHIGQIVAEANKAGRPDVVPVRHRVKFTLTVDPEDLDLQAAPAAEKSEHTLRAWLPFPQTYRTQTDVRLISASPENPRLSNETSPHRTLYFEHSFKDRPTAPVVFTATYEFTSASYAPVLDDARAQPLPADFPAEYIAERPPHIRFSPRVREIANQIMRDDANPLSRARKAFKWVDENIRYNAEEEYCIIPSFTDHALSRGRGDCGIQATLFITLCRAMGVPARWQSGWQTLPHGQHNMHDWAEFYVAPWGWLPADPSYGLQKSEDPAIRDFYFGHIDSYRMIVNFNYGQPLSPAKQSLRSEPADFQRGEVELDGQNLYFDRFSYRFEVSHLADAPAGNRR